MSEFKVGDRVVTQTGDGQGEIFAVNENGVDVSVLLDLDNETQWFFDYELEAVK